MCAGPARRRSGRAAMGQARGGEGLGDNPHGAAVVGERATPGARWGTTGRGSRPGGRRPRDRRPARGPRGPPGHPPVPCHRQGRWAGPDRGRRPRRLGGGRGAGTDAPNAAPARDRLERGRGGGPRVGPSLSRRGGALQPPSAPTAAAPRACAPGVLRAPGGPGTRSDPASGWRSGGCRGRRRQAAGAAPRFARGGGEGRRAPPGWPWTPEPAAAPRAHGAVGWPAGHPARALCRHRPQAPRARLWRPPHAGAPRGRDGPEGGGRVASRQRAAWDRATRQLLAGPAHGPEPVAAAACAHRSPGAGVTAGAAAGASGRANPPGARGDHRAPVERGGQAGHAAADGVQDDDHVFSGDGPPRRGPTPARPPPGNGPPARPPGTGGPCDLWYRSPAWRTP
jgi:hypothetical protein